MMSSTAHPVDPCVSIVDPPAVNVRLGPDGEAYVDIISIAFLSIPCPAPKLRRPTGVQRLAMDIHVIVALTVKSNCYGLSADTKARHERLYRLKEAGDWRAALARCRARALELSQLSVRALADSKLAVWQREGMLMPLAAFDAGQAFSRDDVYEIFRSLPLEVGNHGIKDNSSNFIQPPQGDVADGCQIHHAEDDTVVSALCIVVLLLLAALSAANSPGSGATEAEAADRQHDLQLVDAIVRTGVTAAYIQEFLAQQVLLELGGAEARLTDFCANRGLYVTAFELALVEAASQRQWRLADTLRNADELLEMFGRQVTSNDYAFTLVNTLTGKGACWGDSGFGGNCSSVDFSNVQQEPLRAEEPPFAHSRGATVKANAFAFLALSSAGGECWGSDDNGGACSGLDLSGITDVAATDYSFAALDAVNGRGLCWGSPAYGGECTGVDFTQVSKIYGNLLAF
ncbi:unnamed protein product, partial [Symbiodinium microadriaticum]